MIAKGPFDVKMIPQPGSDDPDWKDLGRFLLDKLYHGDLSGVGKGEMLTGGTAVKNSAGYVAMERVTGTLHGKSGSFIVQHSATMTRGTPDLSIRVVPDSGTGELSGLTGSMAIIIENGKHLYELTYTLEP